MKIIYMGTPDFAVPALKALSSSRHTVSLVVTQPDRPKGRSAKPAESAVKICAKELGIPVFQPEKIREKEAVERLGEENADLIVAAAFGQILSREILDLPAFGCLNIHGSLLPKYRGAAPIQWAMINGEKETGDTIMRMNEGMDTGDILAQATTKILPEDTTETLYKRLSEMGAELLLDTIDRLEKGMITGRVQDESLASRAPMLKKQMGNIDWNKSASAISFMVRGMNPWPCAYTYWNGKLLKVWSAEIIADASSAFAEMSGVVPGTIVFTDPDAIAVHTGSGLLALKEVQLEGKKRMDTGTFLLGNRMKRGDVLTNTR